jgi:predicted alpha/beta-hydrolase family hydrolase
VEVLALPADPELLFDGPTDASRTIVLAHGAGAGMDSPFMEFFATGLAKRGFRVVRFEYPYMASKRVTGKQKPPDREPVLRETWLKVVNMLGRERVCPANRVGCLGGWQPRARRALRLGWRGEVRNSTRQKG